MELVLGFSVSAFILAMAIVGYRTCEDKRKSNNFYLDTVIAFKVGVIEKKAKDNGVNLIYPIQKDEFIDKIEAELERDLNGTD